MKAIYPVKVQPSFIQLYKPSDIISSTEYFISFIELSLSLSSENNNFK